MNGQPPTNEQQALQLLRAAYQRWQSEPPLQVTVDKRDAYVLMGGIQLLTRHPALEPKMRAQFVKFGRQLQDAICDDAELYALAETGWSTDHDVDQP